MSPYDRLLKLLPPDKRVEAALDFEKLSTDPHSPIYVFYSIILQSMDSKFEERLAATDAKVQQLAAQHDKGQAETQITVNRAISNLSGDHTWRKGITKSIVNGLVWLVSVAAGSMAILLILIKTEISPLKEVIETEIAPMREVTAEYRSIVRNLSDDPESLVAFAQSSKEANSEALSTALSLHAISKLMTLPNMQTHRGDDGFLTIYGPKSSMPVGTLEDGRTWVKLANPAAFVSPDRTPSIDNAKEARDKLEKKKPK